MLRTTLAAFALLSLPAAAGATTIQTSLPSFVAAVAGSTVSVTSVVDPTVDFVNDGTVPVSSFTLVNGVGVTLAGTGDYVYISGFQGPQYGDGYMGQLVDTTNGTETLTFSSPLAAFGLTVRPDVAGIPATTDTLTITADDGTTGKLTTTYGLSTVQFVGFTGGNVRSLTISSSTAPDIFLGEFRTVAAAAAVPEPATAALLLAGLAGVGVLRRRTAQ